MSSSTRPRGRVAPAIFLTGGMVSFTVAGVLAAAPATADKGGAPPGSNGTIKIDGISFDDQKANHPHVSCPFQVSLWGFDQASDTATVSFEAQAPSKTTPGNDPQAVPVTSGATSFSFTGTGNDQDLDHIEQYTLDTSTLAKQPIQGYHIKVTVTVTSPTSADLTPALASHGPNGNGNGPSSNANNNNGNNGNGNGNAGANGNNGNNSNGNAGGNGNGNGKNGNQGTTTKYKVFWMGDCPTPSTPTQSPTPTPTASTGGTTGGSTQTPVTSPTQATTAPTTAVLGEKVTRKPASSSKPPTTSVKATHVTQLPFTGLPSMVLRVMIPAALGFILTGCGLVSAARRQRMRFQV